MRSKYENTLYRQKRGILYLSNLETLTIALKNTILYIYKKNGFTKRGIKTIATIKNLLPLDNRLLFVKSG